jgi:lipopolysaccharide biosynthesis glycosyltransferase
VPDNAKNIMDIFKIKVVIVDYIESTDFNRPRMFSRYPIIHKFFTKWNCLKLTQYNKIFFLDIDMVVVGDIDSVFEIDTPATRLILNENIYKKEEHRLEIYKRFINPDIVNNGEVPKLYTEELLFRKGGGIDGGCMLLTPNINDFKDYIDYLKTFDPESKHYELNAIPTDDELTLLHFYYKKKVLWNYLDMRWSYIQAVYDDLSDNKKIIDKKDIKILNFIGSYKPWDYNLLTLFPDTEEWYKYWNIVKSDYKHLSTQLNQMVCTSVPDYKHKEKKDDEIKRNLIIKNWFFSSLQDGKTPPPDNLLKPFELKLWKNNPLRKPYGNSKKKISGGIHKQKSSKKKIKKSSKKKIKKSSKKKIKKN